MWICYTKKISLIPALQCAARPEAQQNVCAPSGSDLLRANNRLTSEQDNQNLMQVPSNAVLSIC